MVHVFLGAKREDPINAEAVLVWDLGGFCHGQEGDTAKLVGDDDDAEFGDLNDHVEAFVLTDVAQHWWDLLV